MLFWFASAYPNRPQLALNFLTGLTHASANNLELLDGPLSDALGRLKLAGHFERNFILVMGDHGQRIVRWGTMGFGEEFGTFIQNL